MVVDVITIVVLVHEGVVLLDVIFGVGNRLLWLTGILVTVTFGFLVDWKDAVLLVLLATKGKLVVDAINVLLCEVEFDVIDVVVEV